LSCCRDKATRLASGNFRVTVISFIPFLSSWWNSSGALTNAKLDEPRAISSFSPMRLLVNRNGRQLGPYTLDEARALVLSGSLAATDWAWPDGATQWIALKDVAGFAPGTTPGAAATPPPPLANAAEEELWRGHPSQILNFKLYAGWTLILLGVLSAIAVRPDFLLLLALAGIALLALLQIAWRNLRLRAIGYVVTTQRVRVIAGIFSKDIQEIELFRVKDTQVQQGFIPRLFGLGTITILSGDKRNPTLVLRGIPHAIELRERLRQEIMLLRQRYGVREMDVM
jgi:membrane protein YdbS with pleckstrin-like domain